MRTPSPPDTLVPMQASEDRETAKGLGDEARGGPMSRPPGDLLPGSPAAADSSLPWWERPPFSPSADFVTSSFARVLSAVVPLQPAAEDSGNADARPALLEEEAFPGSIDDTESFSYEGALRRRVSVSALRSMEAERESPQSGADGAQAHTPIETRRPALFRVPGETSATAAAAPDEEKRLSSATIRLSRAECAQLKQRAAEAGLTVSAYIRSCVFEAEVLRAQVKQALAELRSTPAEKKPPASEALASAADSAEPQRRPWWQLRSHARSISAQA